MYPPADAIFDILVARSGANESQREEFCHHWPDCREFRFQGVLGYGGKVRYDGDRMPPHVSCYPEDENAGRGAVIEDTNRSLSELWLADADVDSSGLGRLSPGAMRSLADADSPASDTYLLRHHLRDAANQIEEIPAELVLRWRSDTALKTRLARAIRGGCPELFAGIYADFPPLILDNVFDVLEGEVQR